MCNSGAFHWEDGGAWLRVGKTQLCNVFFPGRWSHYSVCTLPCYVLHSINARIVSLTTPLWHDSGVKADNCISEVGSRPLVWDENNDLSLAAFQNYLK